MHQKWKEEVKCLISAWTSGKGTKCRSFRVLDEKRNDWRHSVCSSSTCGRQLLENWVRVILVSEGVTNPHWWHHIPSVTPWKGDFVKFSGGYQTFNVERKMSYPGIGMSPLRSRKLKQSEELLFQHRIIYRDLPSLSFHAAALCLSGGYS